MNIQSKENIEETQPEEKIEKKSKVGDFFATVFAIIFLVLFIGVISIVILSTDLKIIIALGCLWIAWSIDLARQELMRIRKAIGKNKYLFGKYLNRRF
jgi:hypothetical protein